MSVKRTLLEKEMEFIVLVFSLKKKKKESRILIFLLNPIFVYLLQYLKMTTKANTQTRHSLRQIF